MTLALANEKIYFKGDEYLTWVPSPWREKKCEQLKVRGNDANNPWKLRRTVCLSSRFFHVRGVAYKEIRRLDALLIQQTGRKMVRVHRGVMLEWPVRFCSCRIFKARCSLCMAIKRIGKEEAGDRSTWTRNASWLVRLRTRTTSTLPQAGSTPFHSTGVADACCFVCQTDIYFNANQHPSCRSNSVPAVDENLHIKD